MLKSLVRELTTTPAAPDGPIPAFSTTVILKITNTRLSDAGRMVDRHQQDPFVTGSPALAMRRHFAKAPTGSDVCTITQLDTGRHLVGLERLARRVRPAARSGRARRRRRGTRSARGGAAVASQPSHGSARHAGRNCSRQRQLLPSHPADAAAG